MKSEKEAYDIEGERYTEIANTIAREVFDFAIVNGGDKIPMGYLMETFIMVSAKIACDIIERSDLTKERMFQILKEMYEGHVDMFLEEHKNRPTDINVN